VSSPDLRPLLVREGLIRDGDVPRSGMLDAAAVVDQKLVGEDVLADLLAREAGSVVIDLDRGTLESEAVALLGQSLARRSLAIPVALEPGGQAIQVAFANPLDTGTLAAVAASTGCEVRALVGTVTAIRRTIDREYGAEVPNTVVLGKRRSSLPPARDAAASAPAPAASSDAPAEPSDAQMLQPIAPEPTKPLAAEGPITMPVHQLEAEASADQKIDALVAALIERGAISRGDYVEALKRLVKGRKE
jgi:hypothetical protein